MRRFGSSFLGDTTAWLPAAQAACLAFMFLLVVGSAFVLAIKLQYPAFGSGSNPIEIFTGVVVVSLACLRAPVHIGGLTLTALPLGALVIIVAGIAWATRTAAASGGRFHRATPIRVGLLFGIICGLMAAVFRYRGGVDPIHAGAIGAFGWGTFWGIAGAALGTSSANLTPVALARRSLEVGRSTRDLLGAGVRSATAMLWIGAILGLAVVLIWTISALATGRLPKPFGAGDAIAAIFYFVAFIPNLVIAALSVSLGASIDVGAQLTLKGDLIGSGVDFSIFGWGEAQTPSYVYLLLLIPLIACAIGGYFARASAGDIKTALRTIVTAAALLAATLGALAWLGEARLGASIVGARGFGRLSADPIEVAIASFIWASVIGGVTASIIDRRTAGGT